MSRMFQDYSLVVYNSNVKEIKYKLWQIWDMKTLDKNDTCSKRKKKIQDK